MYKRQGQGCVQVAMFKRLQREHKRAVVKTFFKHSDFVSEASLYLHSDVKQQCIAPACFATGTWEKVCLSGTTTLSVVYKKYVLKRNCHSCMLLLSEHA